MSALQEQAFRLAAAELGMASAAWLFVEQTAAAEQDAGVARLRDAMGRDWSVLDAVCAAWLGGLRAPAIDARPLQDALAGLQRLVLVGYEAQAVDALLAALPASLRVGLLHGGDPRADIERLLDNHAGRVERLDLERFQTWAGPRSALLGFVYGSAGLQQLFVQAVWLRATGPDVRLQFRELIGWRFMDLPLAVYPRWLNAADAAAFTRVLPA